MADAVGNRARTKRGHVAWASHSLCDTQRVTKTWASVALVRARWRVPPLVGFHDCWLLDSLWCFTCSPHGGLFGMLKGGTAHAAIPCEAGDGWKYHRPPDESTPPHPGRSSVSAGRRPSAGGAFALLRLLISAVSPAARIIGALARSPSREVTRGTPVQRVHVCVAECRAASDRS